MKVLLLIPETKKEKWLEEFISEYEKKLRPFCDYEKKILKSGKNGRAEADLRKKEEAQIILQELKKDDLIIALDEKGASYTSMEFSKKLQSWQNRSMKRLVFIVGGPYGLSEEVLAKSHEKISFSKMTMNHLVIQVFFMEQLYRAYTILGNLPYHNE